MKKLYLPLAILLLTVIFLFAGCSSTATTTPAQTSKPAIRGLVQGNDISALN